MVVSTDRTIDLAVKKKPALMQLQEFQERQKKIAEMEAKLQNQDEELATQQARIKTLHVRTAPLAAFRRIDSALSKLFVATLMTIVQSHTYANLSI